MSLRSWVKEVARSLFFDNSTNGFVSTNVQAAIEEIKNDVDTSASPGFSFGRSGNLSNNTWLQCETVQSNRAGRWVYVNNAVITDVYIGNEDIDTFDVAIYWHEGDSVNLTFVGRVTVTASRGGAFVVNFPVPTDKQLALRIENGSAKSCIVGLSISGTIT